MKAKRRKQIRKAMLVSVASVLAMAITITACLIPRYIKQNKYEEAMQLFNDQNYAEAKTIFASIGGYSNAEYMSTRCDIQPDYDAAMNLYYDGKYAQASWAFATLGNYEDAAEQKEKAELSWRKSCAFTAEKNYFGATPYGSYYIDTNGAVKCLPDDTGRSHNNIKIDEHGKVISIAGGSEYLFAVHEDGTVDNISQNEGVNEAQWKDIIQITPYFLQTNVALKSDGTVIFGSVSSEYDGWLEDIDKWENIVMLETDVDRAANTDIFEAALVGIDADGNIHLCYRINLDFDFILGVKTFAEHPEVFKDIRNIDICLGYENGVRYINAVAIRNDGKIVSYINGEIFIDDAENIVDVMFSYEDIVFTLSSNGDLYRHGSSNRVLADVVAMTQDYFLITRSGTVYSLEYFYYKQKLKNTGVKTCVFDEWLARMS